MVARDVGKDASGKPKPSDTLLGNGVRADFHKGIFASFVRHSSQQTVQRNRVGSGMVGRYGFVVDVIAYGREQAHLIAEPAEHII